MKSKVLQGLASDKIVDFIENLLESSSKDETKQIGGFHPERAPNIKRYRMQGAARLYEDYVSHNPV